MKKLFLNPALVLMIAIPVCLNGQPAKPDSSLCMGYHWTEDQANIMMKQFAWQWNDVASWEKRAGMIREGIVKGMQLDRMPSVQGSFNLFIRNKRTMDGYIVENIAIESFPGFYITGNLYRPVEAVEKNAAVLLPHGHWIDGRMFKETQILGASLARMGAIVFAYDMVGFGESHQATHDIPIALLLQTYNSKRVLDYLLSRPDVDPHRIGITGASGGGTQTFMLTAIDNRISAAVPVVQVSAHFFGGCICESGMPVHKSPAHQTNNVEIAALCAPRPMLLLSDGGDWTSNTPRVEYPYIQRIYSLYNVEHKLENVHLPGEMHDYGPSKRAAACLFFAHHLKLDAEKLPYDYRFDDGFVTILSREELCVFSTGHPLPGNALQGNEAVLNYLGFK